MFTDIAGLSVVVISQGLDNDHTSANWSIADGGIKSGLDVSIFLVAVEWTESVNTQQIVK